MLFRKEHKLKLLFKSGQSQEVWVADWSFSKSGSTFTRFQLVNCSLDDQLVDMLLGQLEAVFVVKTRLRLRWK